MALAGNEVLRPSSASAERHHGAYPAPSTGPLLGLSGEPSGQTTILSLEIPSGDYTPRRVPRADRELATRVGLSELISIRIDVQSKRRQLYNTAVDPMLWLS